MATFPQFSTAPSFLSGGNFQTTTQLADPTVREAYIDNLNFANAVAERPYEQYSGPRVAELNQDQQNAFQGVRNLQTQYQPYLNQAQQAFQGAANYTPGQVTPQTFLQGDIGAYQNPYTQQVIDTSMNDIDRARQLQQQQINAQAASRGAFGGSRQAVAESENSRNYLDQQARTAAQLRNQGFESAASRLGQDIGNNMNAQQFNVNSGLAGQQLNQSAGQQLAGLGGLSQQYGLTAANALNTIGGQQQQQVQANYNTAQQDFQNQFNYPLQQLQIRQSALGVQPYGGDKAVQTPIYQNNLATTLGALGAGTSILGNLGLAAPVGNFLGGLGSSALSGLSGLFGSSSGSSGLPVLGQGFDPNQSF